MKQGTNLKLGVDICYEHLDEIERIEFVFKQRLSTSAEAIKTSVYSKDGEGDVFLDGRTFYIPWTKEETYKFLPNERFYMDTLITIGDSTDNPQTDIVCLVMNLTLFEEV